MTNGEHCHLGSGNFVHHCVREVFEVVAVRSVIVLRPVGSRFGQTVNRFKHIDAERIRSERASFEIPEEPRTNICFRIRKNDNGKASHRDPRRCLTSDHGTARTAPECSSSRRRFTSSRQASDMLALSALSRLSSNATATAERSSAGSARASSKTCSTRAFMRVSLALKGLPPARATVPPHVAPRERGFARFVHLTCHLSAVSTAARSGEFDPVASYRVGLAALRQYDDHSTVEEAHPLMRLCQELEQLLGDEEARPA